MVREDFGEVWKYIAPVIDGIEKYLKETIPKIEGLNFRRTFIDKDGNDATLEKIREEYETIREQFRARCQKQQDDDLIDEHKIAACLCNAFVNKKVFSFEVPTPCPKDLYFCNYTLAMAVAEIVVYLYLVDHYIQMDNDDYLKKLLDNGQLICPPTAPDHESFRTAAIKAMAYDDWYSVSFNILLFSKMMYSLEFYNKQIIEQRIDPSEKKTNN